MESIINDNMVPYHNYRYVFDRVVSSCSKEEILDLLNGENTDKVFANISSKNKI